MIWLAMNKLLLQSRYRCFFNIIFVSALALQSQLQAQNELDTIPEPSFADSFFADDIRPLARLLALKWDGRNLRLRRDWRQPVALEFDPNDPIAVIRARRQQRRSPLCNEFMKAAKILRCASGGISGSGAGSTTITCHGNGYHFVTFEGATDLRFTFTKDKLDRQRFEVRERDDGTLSFLFITDDDIVKVTQKKDGQVLVAVVRGDKTATAKAKDFRELYELRPAVISRVFLPLMKHFGIDLPFTAESNEVRMFVTSKLLSHLDRSDKDLARHLKQLESNLFAERDQATTALRTRLNVWRDKFKEMADDKSVPLETRMRLKSILDDAKSLESESKSIREFVEQNKLMSQNDFLFSLVAAGDDKIRAAVFNQVQQNDPELSNEQIEAKFEAWRESQPKDE